jgi:hypothetical protein
VPGKIAIPGGRPVFPQIPEQVLSNYGLVRVLDAHAEATLVTWHRPGRLPH